MAEDDMVGWHRQLNEHEFEQTPHELTQSILLENEYFAVIPVIPAKV